MTINPRDNRTGKSCRSIADPYDDLLAQLDEGKRQGMIRRLSVGFYEGWTPSRAELSVLVDYELGRISEVEFFAAQRKAGPTARAFHLAGGGSTDTGWASAGGPTGPQRSGAPATSTDPRARKGIVFNVDCGELAGRFRFVATRLRGTGWTIRDEKTYRLVHLEYELLPPGHDRSTESIARPLSFNAAIRCVPDVSAPRSNDDGRSMRHAVGPRGISGSRGPWPVAEEVRRIKFVISRQVPPGSRAAGTPAGVLLIDIAGGRAAWNPVGSSRARQLAVN